jgi:hypothetical protein
MLHGNMSRNEVVKPIYKETWWAEQQAKIKEEKILFYVGKPYFNVGTIGHMDWGDSSWFYDAMKCRDAQDVLQREFFGSFYADPAT